MADLISRAAAIKALNDACEGMQAKENDKSTLADIKSGKGLRPIITQDTNYNWKSAFQEVCFCLEQLPAVDATVMMQPRPRVIRPEEYAAWDADAWAEDQETGWVVALDRTAVPAYIKYIAFDSGSPKRLWTARPSDTQREATPWQ